MYEFGYDKDRYYDLKVLPFPEISFCVFDLETTGYSYDNDEIIEIGAVRIFNKKPGAKFNVLVRSVDHIPSHIVKLTHITQEMINSHGMEYIQAMRMFHTFMDGAILVQHSGPNDFDMNFLSRKYRPSYEMPFINTRTLLKKMYPSIGAYDLDSVSQAFRIDLINHHRALDDAVTTSWIFLKLLEKLEENDISNILEVEQHLGRVLKAK